MHVIRWHLALLFLCASLFPGWEQSAAAATRDAARQQTYLLCLWHDPANLVPKGQRSSFCREVARRTGVTPVEFWRWRALLRYGDKQQRLAFLRLEVRSRTSLGWSWREGVLLAWRTGNVKLCGPYQVSVMDAGLAAATRHVLKNIARCRQ